MAQVTLAFLGTLTRNTPFFEAAQGVGIHCLDFNETTGALTPRTVTSGIDNPTYLAIDRHAPFLYATSEVFEWHEGTVTAYRIDYATGALTYINKQPTLGHLAAHVSTDCVDRNLLVVNYSMQDPAVQPGRSLAVLPIRNGSIRPVSDTLHRQGSGPRKDRQERSHTHCTAVRPDGLLALTDLGTDEVVFSHLDSEAGTVDASHSYTVSLPPASGPRHVVFSSDGRRLYVVNELASTLAVLSHDGRDGRDGRASGQFRVMQIVSTLPSGFDGPNDAAGIQLSPDGRFLFASNRGADSVVAYRVDPTSGQLTVVAHHSSGGHIPRSIAVDPSGRFLLVVNQYSNNLVVLRIDEATGMLSDTDIRMAVGSPTCVRVVRRSVS